MCDDIREKATDDATVSSMESSIVQDVQDVQDVAAAGQTFFSERILHDKGSATGAREGTEVFGCTETPGQCGHGRVSG